MQRNFWLDCFRALAILLVILAHTVNSYGSPVNLFPLQFGGTGVDLFFVLSGWLIGNQLFKENRKYGNIQIRRFWIRRWMRTIPAYYAVLFATIFQQYLTRENFSFPWQHLFFIQNYQEQLQLFYISWSLSVEEQFYLFIAPFVVFILHKKNGIQFAALIALLLAPTVFRVTGLYDNLIETHVRLDCCAMGVLLAYIKYMKQDLWKGLISLAKRLFPYAFSVYFLFFVAWYNPSWPVPEPSKLALAMIFGIWIIWSETRDNPKESLFNSIVMHFSTRSYAMYLLHVDALVLTKKLLTSDVFFPIYLIVAMIITLIASEFLYRLIEIPFMKARKKFSFSQSRNENGINTHPEALR